MKSRYKYAPKRLKFYGEDSFIVKNPRTKKYLMAVAQEPDVLVKQNLVNAEVVPMDNTTITNPTEVSSDVVTSAPPMMITSPNWESLSCSQIQSEIDGIRNMLMVSKFSDPSVYQAYQDIIAKGEYVYTQKCVKSQLPNDIIPADEVPPPPSVYVEPTWSSLTCEQIKQEIANVQSMLVNTTNEEQRQILMMSYKNGTRAFERCNVSETPVPEPTPLPPAPPNLPSETTTTTTSGGGGVGAPPITTITTTGTPIIATASAGGLTSGAMPKPLGGGGKQEPQAPKKQTKLNLWWLVAAAAGIYLLISKK